MIGKNSKKSKTLLYRKYVIPEKKLKVGDNKLLLF